MNYLWDMINSLQILVNIPLFALCFPANAAILLCYILKIATFSIIDTSSMFEKVFSFSES
jgi:hypothetical protein